jgi:Zn-dependent peptidase ImmA (M78 family)
MEQTEDIIGDATKARAKMARAEALKLWKKHGQGQIPVMPEKIIEALGIPYREAELNKMEGVAHADEKGIVFIMYNKNLAPNRKRSTLAHELGHIVLAHVAMEASSQLSMNAQEREAKEFASALLVPADDLKAFMKQGYKRIEQVMERYQVSKDVALISVTRNRLFPRLLATAVALNLV